MNQPLARIPHRESRFLSDVTSSARCGQIPQDEPKRKIIGLDCTHATKILATLVYVLAVAGAANGQVIFNASFDTQPLGPLAMGSPPNLPQSIIILDPATVNVVASAGDLTDKPVLLHSSPRGHGTAVFDNPSGLRSGDCRVSWDSLVLAMPSNDRLGDGNVGLLGWTDRIWEITYVTSGQFSVKDANGLHSVRKFVIEQKTHFDLDLHLDRRTYEMFVNNGSVLTGDLAASRVFRSTCFRSSSRTDFKLPDMAFDNFRVTASKGERLIELATKPPGLDIRISALAVHPKGDIIVGGTKTGPVEGEVLLKDGAISDEWYPQTAFVAKYSLAGSMSWIRSVVVSNKTSGEAVAFDPAGNVFLAGEATDSSSAFVIKFDSDGNKLWRQSPGIDDLNYAKAVACDGEENSVITGYITRISGGGLVGIMRTRHDCLMIKYDPSGKEKWRQIWGRPGDLDEREFHESLKLVQQSYNEALAVAVAKDGAIYVAGAGDQENKRDAFLAKFRSDGRKEWSHFIGTGGQRGSALGVIVDDSKKIYTTGFSAKPTTKEQDGPVRLEPFVAMFDSAGKQQWLRKPKRFSIGSHLCVGLEGDVVVVGEDNEDGFLLRYDKHGVEKAEESLSNYIVPTGIAYSTNNNVLLVSAMVRIPDRRAVFARNDVRLSLVLRKETTGKK